jgi:cytochrome c-type biogenesis protein CcmH
VRRAAVLGTVILALVPALAAAQLDEAAASEASRIAAPERAPSLDEAALLGPPAGSPLSGAELDARTRALAERMRCPVCQGLSIADSPSASAVAMLGEVRDLLARGYTEDQVLDYFVRAYGEFVLLQPTATGFNLVVWLLPLAAVLGGALLIAARLRAARRRRHPGPDAGPGGDEDNDDQDLDPYLERVRSEVSR